jgi:hypothetical protein
MVASISDERPSWPERLPKEVRQVAGATKSLGPFGAAHARVHPIGPDDDPGVPGHRRAAGGVAADAAEANAGMAAPPSRRSNSPRSRIRSVDDSMGMLPQPPDFLRTTTAKPLARHH